MPKILSGIVVANANAKTITVKTEIIKEHPIYRKKFRVNKKYLVHDENNQAEIGDLVKIIECRPRSARKRFELQSIVKTAKIKKADTLENLKIDEDVITKTPKSKKVNTKVTTQEKVSKEPKS